MPIISLSISDKLLKMLDKRLAESGYTGRSEALRELVRDYVAGQEWEQVDGKSSIAVVSVLYDKEKPNSPVSSILHEYEDLLQTTLHTHLDKDNCLEVLIINGNGKRIRSLVERIRKVKGVKQAKYITTASGV